MCNRQIMGVSQIVHAVCHTACVLRDKSQRGKVRETDRGWGADYLRQDRCAHIIS